MSNDPPNAIPLSVKSYTERWKEHLQSTKLDLRGLLIESVASHEGWEESAIALVDEAIMPLIRSHPTPDMALVQFAQKLLRNHRQHSWQRSGWGT